MADISIVNHGSIVTVRPLTHAATQWLQDNTDGMWFGGALVVEPRYVGDLVAGMVEEGMEVSA